MLVDGIKAYPEILDAAITQDGKQISLVLIVAWMTTEGQAQALGDNYVRMAKLLLKDGKVGKDGPGRGAYDYLVGVYYVNGDLVAMGAKVGVAERIRW